MKLSTEMFIEESKKLGINYKKYVHINALKVDELTKNNNFVKKQVVNTGIKVLDEDSPSKQTIEDTYYYFEEGNFIIVLIENYSNFIYRNDSDYQNQLGEIEQFIIQR